MTVEITRLQSKGLSAEMAEKVRLYLETGDEAVAHGAAVLEPGLFWKQQEIGKALVSECIWSDTTRAILRFFVIRGGAVKNPTSIEAVLVGILDHLNGRDQRENRGLALEVVNELKEHHRALRSLVDDFLSSTYKDDWDLDPAGSADAPYLSPVSNLIHGEVQAAGVKMLEAITDRPGLLAGLARYHPEITIAWCGKSPRWKDEAVHGWRVILENSTAYDELCLKCVEELRTRQAGSAFIILYGLNHLRDGAHLQRLIGYAKEPLAALIYLALELLLEHRGEEVIAIMTRAFADKRSARHVSGIEHPPYARLFAKAVEKWDEGGADLLREAFARLDRGELSLVISRIPSLDPEKHALFRKIFVERLARVETRDLPDYWSIVTETHAPAFIGDFEAMLSGKSKVLREMAAGLFAGKWGADFAPQALDLLGSKKADARLGGAAFFARLGDAAWLPQLAAVAEGETSEAVKDALHEAMKACGKFHEAHSSGATSDPAGIVALACKQAAKLKLPPSPWLKRDSLPEFFLTNGTAVSHEAVTFMIARQAKHKELGAAPEIVPLLGVIDRSSSTAFANALVEGFLGSGQAASDRWALMLGGSLGDNRIITLLLPRINDWCENSRHKLAEYAAQAISLLPGNEPLMVLDTLSNRYRSKFKNVGKACAEAFNAAAAARGITTDELGDLVVPDFGFDAEGIRRFDWDGGGASAELGADFKLTWFDPETDKSWKTLPAAAPETVKDEVKTLAKLLREAVKGQTARLEMMLVRQRRWPVARWRELFENHPLLRSFASNLVWGVYDGSGKLLRTFRRYANGLLADAGGALEELPEADTVIGLVHPLELEEEVTDAWRVHLTRFKVKPPFPQLDRPVELMDPLHGNRREIPVTKEKQLGAGTFRSRAEKRGWLRGSVVDAGGISSYYKVYPGAGIEVILPTENFWIGCDPMETITLGGAWFVKADSVERGSYTYDEPSPDDPRVLRFDQVPAVVYSETIGDLKAIIATRE